ncbi:crosslink repair DNA glycosylase YcaQ family protein [Actinoplanes oblitus]|uniref:Crosslink repair DNA glycosylase YcaQ family protein n=1 Tax=Actinoplanes oblitus TaxID=3040509 RepID=A0ABY8WGN4_9ACTN|nr:crosslink repair DNA glycosylase YcaQ family protein [Actinoplanes oblitus]WIM97024.1 crosslink repair DNA glycosylase YcaQ family protein [Actinoplanes oblitus]
MIEVDRRQVLAFRVAALGLAERVDARPADLPVLDLGVQEYTPGSTHVALAARTSAQSEDERLVTVWAARGAPHLHRRADLESLTARLWPVSDADAAARIKSGQISDGMRLGIAALRVTAEAFRAVVREPMPRGEVSTEVSKRVPRELTYDCKACGARHIAGNVWQQSGLPGAVQVLSRGRDAMLGPLDAPRPALPEANQGIDELITTYLRFLGPAGPAEVAKYLLSPTAEIRARWPAGLVEVRVDGRKAWLPADRVSALESAATPRGVRLLPAMDPLLQGRDRDLLVPDRERQKEVWRVLGNPGVVLLDGEIAGVWRPRMAGKKRVDLTVTGFGAFSAAQRELIETEATVVARARGVPAATTVFE